MIVLALEFDVEVGEDVVEDLGLAVGDDRGRAVLQVIEDRHVVMMARAADVEGEGSVGVGGLVDGDRAGDAEGSEQAVRSLVGAGAEVEDVGVAGGDSVAELKSPQTWDGHGLGVCAFELPIGSKVVSWVVSWVVS